MLGEELYLAPWRAHAESEVHDQAISRKIHSSSVPIGAPLPLPLRGSRLLNMRLESLNQIHHI
jgi:hypothetical protein